MPRRCSVAGCRSNYDGEAPSTFSLPKSGALRDLWLRKIPTDFSGIKNPVVCIHHFDEKCIIRRDKVIYKGELREYDRERPKLVEDAVPSIFPNCPSYLSTRLPNVQRLVDVESKNFETAIKESLETFKNYIAEQSLKSISDVIKYIERKGLPNKWIHYIQDEQLFLCLMERDKDRPFVLSSVTLDKHLKLTVFMENTQILNKHLPLKNCNLQTVNEFEDVISFMSKNTTKSSKCTVQSALETIKLSQMHQDSDAIQFCIEQIELSNVSKEARRYNNQTMILASCLFIHSPSAYNALLKSSLLILPHPRNLRKLICNFDLSISTLSSSAEYLKGRIKYLKPQELLVNLILDEIYIQPQLTFKGGQIYGSSSTNGSQLAKTVQVFMVSSVFSRYKDVVTLVPVHNMTSEYLKSLILSLITVSENMGFRIISLISDNNSVNRKAFQLMTENRILQSCIPHPLDETRSLFFIFDTVHILKCIRNNWGNKKNKNKSIHFLDMPTNSILVAQYHHLEKMYEVEKLSLLKYGHTLSAKVLYPSNIQKQNVSLALKLFNENNITALKHIAEQHPDLFQSVESTCTFLKIFVNWWKIVNVKNSCEGNRFNDKFREPVKRDSNMQIEFLENLSIWLKNWQQSVPIANALTSQTFQALITTTDAFLKLIPYIFNKYDMEYILLGKFQSDDLESRFSSYRQLSGANYYITYMQVLENERKLRFKNTVLFSLKHKDINLTTLMPINHDKNISEVKLEMFTEVIELSFNFPSVPTTILPILVMIGGYCVRKVLNKKKCSTCTSWLQLDKSITVDESYNFLKDNDRGKLFMPTGIVVYTAAIIWDTMTHLIEHPEFLHLTQQLYVLHKIGSIKLERAEHAMMLNEYSCNLKLVDKLKDVCFIVSKILINNYVKGINDSKIELRSPSTSRKIKKLKS